MSSSERGPISATDAAAALQTIQQARNAAQAGPAPAWMAPACAVLFAGMQASIGLSGPSAGRSWVFIPVASACAAALLAVMARGARSGGVVAWPSGSVAARVRVQGLLVAAYALGWLIAIPFGAQGGWIGSGVTLGLAQWIAGWSSARAQAKRAER